MADAKVWGSKEEKEKMENKSRLRLAEPARVDGMSSSAAKDADSYYGVLTARNPILTVALYG